MNKLPPLNFRSRKRGCSGRLEFFKGDNLYGILLEASTDLEREREGERKRRKEGTKKEKEYYFRVF